MFYKPISHLHVNLQLPKELLVFLARKRKQRIEKTKGKFAYGFRPSLILNTSAIRKLFG